jgi:hypothetical protein
MRTNPIRFCSKLLMDDRSTDRRRLNLTVTCRGNQCEQGLSIHSVRVAKTHRNALHLAVTLWFHRRLRGAGPKSYGLFCKRGLLFAYLRRSNTSRAPSRCVCAPQPYAHQWILLEPRISHSSVPSNALLEFVSASQASATEAAPGPRRCFRSLGQPCLEASPRWAYRQTLGAGAIVTGRALCLLRCYRSFAELRPHSAACACGRTAAAGALDFPWRCRLFRVPSSLRFPFQ